MVTGMLTGPTDTSTWCFCCCGMAISSCSVPGADPGRWYCEAAPPLGPPFAEPLLPLVEPLVLRPLAWEAPLVVVVDSEATRLLGGQGCAPFCPGACKDGACCWGAGRRAGGVMGR